MGLSVDHLAHQRQHLSRTSQSNRQREPLVKLAQPKHAPEHPLHQLQRAIGNRAVGRFIQAELRVSQAGDVCEQEADRVAEQVVRVPDSLPAISSNGSPVRIHRKCVACASEERHEYGAEEPTVQRQSLAATVVPAIQRQLDDEEEMLQSKGISGGLPELTPETEAHIEALQGSRQPLPQPARAFFRPSFGRDLSHVRIHTNVQAAEAARPLNAQAHTLGHDIVWDAGEYAPYSSGGRRLLARGGFDHAQPQATHMRKANDAEGQAEEAATYALPIPTTVGLSPLSTPAVQRQPKPQLTRAEEVRLSFTSPGEIAVVPNPPAISLYNFAIDRAVLKEKHVAALQMLTSLIKQFPGGKLNIETKGHADSSGEDTINDPLSKNRALSVQKVLASAAGVSVPVSSCGEHCPVTTNDTVEGRSRNRRVDIALSSSKKGDDIDWPSLCELAPEVCLCLANPALCREKDDDGDGDGWPSLCPGPLGKLICGVVLCLLAFKLCLSGLCRLLPELCLATICKIFPSLCKGKRKKSKDEPKRKKACPKVDLPSGKYKAHKDEQIGYARLWYPFKMNVDFAEDSSGCECACGEYEQLVRGYFRIDETGNGDWKTERKQLSAGVYLDETAFREDGHIASGPYGHRYWDDDKRTDPKPNNKGDQFRLTRRKGCRYRGEDEPGYEMREDYPAKLEMHLEFLGTAVDVCMAPGQRTPLAAHQKEWVLDGAAQAKAPPTGPKPGFITSLPQDAKPGDTLTLEIRTQGRDCRVEIPAIIIDIQPDASLVTIFTQNSERVQIDPDACPDVWILPYQSLTMPYEYVFKA